MLLIPWADFPSFTQVITLDDKSYNFTAKWNVTYQYWTIDIADSIGNPIIFGVKLVFNEDLLIRYRLKDLPPGNLRVIATTSQEESPSRNNIGDTVELQYIPIQ